MPRKSNECPQCGGLKDYRSRLCKNCGRNVNDGVDYSKLTPQWLACFSGFFIGEGSVGVYFDKRARGSYHARMSLKLRADDKPALDDIVDKLGGKIYSDKNRTSQQWGWASCDTSHINEICGLILENCPIPGKKLIEIRLVQEFCTWRLAQPYRVTDWSYAEDLAIRLSRCKLFTEIG